MMKYFDDLSVKEIAAVQGVTENTVLSRLYYGRNAIKAEVEAYEKKHDTKLHAIPFLPLLRIVFAEVPKQMSKTAVVAAAKAIGAATGVHIVATVGGTAAVAGTTAAVAGGVGAAGVAAGTSAGAGIAAAVAAIPLSVKIGAGIAAAVIAVGAPFAANQIAKNTAPVEETRTTVTTHVEEQETVSPVIPADWDNVECCRTFKKASYHITIKRGAKTTVNGRDFDGKYLPYADGEHFEVIFGL
jgi:hypothetical protein